MPAPPWGQEFDNNLMHKEGATNATATRLQKQSGRDEHSIVADAQFIDPAHGDCRIKEGSPALVAGLRQLIDGPLWRAKTRLESSRAHAGSARPKALNIKR